MEDDLLSRVLLVPSPNVLPTDNHDDVIQGLCQQHQLVLLLKFGDEAYNLPPNSCLPHNAKLVSYDYETLDEALDQIEQHLSDFGIGVISRHRLSPNPLPFVLGGSILQVPQDVRLSFFDKNTPRQPVKLEIKTESEWDLF